MLREAIDKKAKKVRGKKQTNRNTLNSTVACCCILDFHIHTNRIIKQMALELEAVPVMCLFLMGIFQKLRV